MIEGYFKKEEEGKSPKFLFVYAGSDEDATYVIVLDQYGDTVNTYIDYSPPAYDFSNVKMLWRSMEIENRVEGNQILNLFIFVNLRSSFLEIIYIRLKIIGTQRGASKNEKHLLRSTLL